MSARYGIGRLANSNEFGRLQRKVENLYDGYNYNSNTSNFVKCSDLIHENANVQRKLCNSLSDIAVEGAQPCGTTSTSSWYCPSKSTTSTSRSRWPYYSDYYSSCHYDNSTTTQQNTTTTGAAYAPYTSTSTTTSTTYCTSTPSCTCGCGGLSSASTAFNAELAVSAAAEAALKSERAVYDALRKKNAEIADINYKYTKDVTCLENELSSAKINNCDLKAKLEETKDELLSERIRSSSRARAAQADIDDLSIKLKSAECRLASLEPRAELARQLELDIAGMKAEISRIRAENALLCDTNEIQAKIIKSRSSSPAYGLCHQETSSTLSSGHHVGGNGNGTHEVTFHETVTHRSRSPSPICSGPCGGYGRCSPYLQQQPASACENERTVETTTITHHRSVSPPCNSALNRSRPMLFTSSTSSTSRHCLVSPLSPNHSTQLIRQESLISRFNDLYTRDRMNAMDLLRHYSNFENNQRIVFAAVQEAFSVAKRTFADWKIRIRSTLALSHCGPESLEEAVQNYVNRNVDLYDLPYMSAEVVSALNRNPKISLPIGVSFTVISSFIREACRIAWEMSTLAFPLDIAFALDGEVFDDSKYRRSFDSDICALLVNHHIWPCLMQGLRVISKGEAHTRRNDIVKYCTTSTITRRSSPLRSCLRNRSPSPCRSSTSTLRRSRSTYCIYY